jgi:hypothetical protein
MRQNNFDSLAFSPTSAQVPAVMNLRFNDTVPPALENTLLPQAHWLLSIPVVEKIPIEAHAALARLLAAPPALGESRPALGALRFEMTWNGGFRRDRVQPEDFPIGREEKDFGIVDILHQCETFGLYRLNIRPGAGIPLHVHRRMQEWEMVISTGLLLQNQEAPLHHTSAWTHEVAHRYDNPSSHWKTVLCVDSPPFIPSDEILVN